MTSDLHVRRIPDAELQERIVAVGKQMLEANERFAKSHAVEDRSARDSAWIMQKALLHERARRRRIVEAMEKERGLA